MTSIKFGYLTDCQGLFLHLGIRGPTGVRHRLSQASVLLGLPKTVHTTLGESCCAGWGGLITFKLANRGEIAPSLEARQKVVTSIKFSYLIDCQGLFLHLGIHGPTGV